MQYIHYEIAFLRFYVHMDGGLKEWDEYYRLHQYYEFKILHNTEVT